MTTFGFAPLSSVIATRFIQASEAPVMQALAAEMLADLAANVNGNIIGATLAGAGDGYTFVTTVDVSNSPGGPSYEASEARFAYYLAATAEELAVARIPVLAALRAETPPFQGAILNLIDDQLVGSSKGTHFMGLIVAVWMGGG